MSPRGHSPAKSALSAWRQDPRNDRSCSGRDRRIAPPPHRSCRSRRQAKNANAESGPTPCAERPETSHRGPKWRPFADEIVNLPCAPADEPDLSELPRIRVTARRAPNIGNCAKALSVTHPTPILGPGQLRPGRPGNTMHGGSQSGAYVSILLQSHEGG